MNSKISCLMKKRKVQKSMSNGLLIVFKKEKRTIFILLHVGKCIKYIIICLLRGDLKIGAWEVNEKEIS